jgi:hypothetical protein
MMITISRDGQQFGPYTLDDARAHLAGGALLATDLAWYEGAPDWMPLDQVPGVSGQPAFAAAPDPNDPLAAANPAVAAAGVASSTSAKGSKKKVVIIAGSVVGVGAIAAVLLFVYPGFLNEKTGSGGDNGGGGPAGGSGGGATFAKEIEPILKGSTCYDCHDGVDLNDKANKALNLTLTESIQGTLKAGDPDNSELFKRISNKDSEDRMPPKGEMLSDDDVKKIRDWIKAGAEF